MTDNAVHQVPDASPTQPLPRPRWKSAALRLLLHAGFLVVAVLCFAVYLHLRVGGRGAGATASLVAGAIFGFLPVRDIIRVAFRVEGTMLHLVHALGGLALFALPASGVVSGAPLLSRAAMAPFAIMGAAQALMHSQHPRNAQQSAALQRFVSGLPQVAQLAGSRDLASPENARRAATVLADIVARAQALGQTELQSDPGFRSAFSQVSTRFGASLGLDAVDLVLGKLAANPATAGLVPGIRRQLAQARQTLTATAGTR